MACLSINGELIGGCRFASSLVLLLLLSVSAAAQSKLLSERGIVPYGDYHGGDLDLISLDDSLIGIEDPAKTQTAPDKNNQKETELEDVIFNETGGLRADPKAKPGAPGSAENLHDARVAVGEIAHRVLESNHPEREQAPHTLTHETVRDLNAGNKDVAKHLNDALTAARSHSNTTNDAMHFRTGRHKFKSLYGRKGTMYFGPFLDVTGGRRYLTIAP